MRSGVALLDDWLGGLRSGRPHLLTGGPGSGKSTLALSFAEAGLRRGEPVAMLVHRSHDVRAHAAYFGIDLEASLRDGRLLLLRYTADSREQVARATPPERVVHDLERLMARHRPKRIVIDGFAPLLGSAAPAGLVIGALAGWLEHSGSCSLLTFPEDLAAGYDRNLEPLVQSAAALVRLAHEEGEGVRRAELLSIRYPAPASAVVRFGIRARTGLVIEQQLRGDRLARATL